jgi:hypothetical protein
LPFEPLNPNAETVTAMKAARRGDLIKAGSPARWNDHRDCHIAADLTVSFGSDPNFQSRRPFDHSRERLINRKARCTPPPLSTLYGLPRNRPGVIFAQFSRFL